MSPDTQVTLTLDVPNEVHLGRAFSNRTQPPAPTNVEEPSLIGNYWVSNLDPDGDRDFMILLSTSKNVDTVPPFCVGTVQPNIIPSPIPPLPIYCLLILLSLSWAGRSEDRIPVGARFSSPVQTGPGADPASYTRGTESFRGISGRGVVLTTHPHLALRLKKE